MALVEPAAISHWSALHHHCLTAQLPRKVFVLTTTEASVPRVRRANTQERRNEYSAGGMVYRFIQVKPERFFGTERVWIGDSRVVFTDPERTLLDGLSMPQYNGDFAEVLHAFGVRMSELDIERIIAYALELGAATTKRLGWVLEHHGVDLSALDRLLDSPIRGYRKLDPTGPANGPANRRWRVWENLPGRVAT
jgi:predicted transcriptional regulator of viral defense system